MSTTVRPHRLPNGKWGALATDSIDVGDRVTYEARSGKRWDARITGIVGVLAETAPCTAGRRTEHQRERPAPETMPCINVGCGGTWSWSGQAIRGRRDRMCASCCNDPRPPC